MDENASVKERGQGGSQSHLESKVDQLSNEVARLTDLFARVVSRGEEGRVNAHGVSAADLEVEVEDLGADLNNQH